MGDVHEPAGPVTVIPILVVLRPIVMAPARAAAAICVQVFPVPFRACTTPDRAASLAELLRLIWAAKIIPQLMIPKTNNRRIGTTSANSTAATPASLRVCVVLRIAPRLAEVT